MPDAPVLLAGRYRLGESLGRGGMGQVLLARDETLQRDVAIKEIDQPAGADGGTSARRTLREARASARINHPNVVQVYDVLQLDDRTWIVMEYVPSRSLREEIAEQGSLDPQRVARIGLELLGALRTAHRLGVEHRDVKPANVLLADDGRVLLTDFGIAAVDDDGVISRSDILVGSPQFMAPERAHGRPSGPEADLWSLGATLYAAVEGRAPYQRGSTMATLTALATEEPDPPVHAGVLRPLLDGLLRKDPATRMTAEQAEDLARSIITGLSSSGEVPVAPPKPSGLAGLAAAIPAMFRIPRPRASGERLPVPGDSATPGPGVTPVAQGVSGSGTGEPAGDGPAGNAETGANAGPGGNAGPGANADPGKDEAGSVANAEDEADSGDAAGGTAGQPVRPADSTPGPRVTEVPRPEPVTKAASAGVPERKAGVPGRETGVPGRETDVPGRTAGTTRHRRGLLVAAVASSVVLVVAIGWLVVATGWVTAGRPGGLEAQPTDATAPPSVGATRTSVMPSPAGSPAASSSPVPTGSQRPVLPAGWVEYRDDTGFSLYVPAGWKRTKEGSIVYFRGDGKILGIDQTDEPKSDPVKDWRTQADNRVAGGDFPQYDEVHIKAVDYFQKAADWEFTFMRDGVRRHVNNRGTVVSKSLAYGIYWQTPDSEWSSSRDDLQLVFDSFVPAKN